MLQFICTTKSYPLLSPVCEEEQGKREQVTEQSKKAASSQSCSAACLELVISLYVVIFLSMGFDVPQAQEKTKSTWNSLDTLLQTRVVLSNTIYHDRRSNCFPAAFLFTISRNLWTFRNTLENWRQVSVICGYGSIQPVFRCATGSQTITLATSGH